MKTSVIISTYNQPAWLEKVLWGYEVQSTRSFDIVIADDGSGEETRAVIQRFQQHSWMTILHVWHEHIGYQKCQILNKAIKAAPGEYLIFTDGDCIPRKDFVEQHLRFARPGYFLSAGTVRLPMETSKQITQDDIVRGAAFDTKWLASHGYKPGFFKKLKLTAGRLSGVLNQLTTAKWTWNGCNSSGWKCDLIAVNGFDERLEYGGQDRELGERMINLGIRPSMHRFDLVCIHLDHARGYKTQSSIDNIRRLRRIVRSYKMIWTSYGLRRETPSFS